MNNCASPEGEVAGNTWWTLGMVRQSDEGGWFEGGSTPQVARRERGATREKNSAIGGGKVVGQVAILWVFGSLLVASFCGARWKRRW